MSNCPICGHLLNDTISGQVGQKSYDCVRCGEFTLDPILNRNLLNIINGDAKQSALLSLYIRRMHQGQDWPLLTGDLVRRIIDQEILPNPQEQAENMIRWLGKNLNGPGVQLDISDSSCGGIIGSIDLHGFQFVIAGLLQQDMLTGKQTIDGNNFVTLTFRGWQKFEELRKGVSTGRRAFMAMPFGKPEVDRVVDECFRPSVDETGFTLTRVDDTPKAGLIDDRMRVEIQSSRFLIADLTHGNKGAYWEAGYAEGLGKPVIYTCEATKFADDSHFDTNHHLTVMWDANDLSVTAENLKATIRATIPEAS